MTNDLPQSTDQLTSQPSHPQTSNPLYVGGVLSIILAIILFACGACSTLFYVIVPLSSRTSNDTSANVLFGSAALLTVAFGVVLLWQSINIVRGKASPTAARLFPPTIVFVIGCLLAVIIGTGALAIPQISAWLFPPWHFIAASFIPLTFIAYAAHRLGKSSGFRALLTAWTWGMLGATPLALIAEFLIGIVFFIFIGVVIVLDPANRNLIEQMRVDILRNRSSFDPAIVKLLMNPAIAGTILLYIAGVVPLVEETLKTLVVAFIDPRRTKLQDAVLWGIVAGAGFAIFENITNAGNGTMLWALAILSRVGATIMHITNGVTMGRGWYAARVEGRWGRLVIAFGVSVFLHSLWNAIAIVLGGSAAYATSNTTSLTELSPLMGLFIGAMVIVLIVLASIGLVWIVHSVNTVQESAT